MKKNLICESGGRRHFSLWMGLPARGCGDSAWKRPGSNSQGWVTDTMSVLKAGDAAPSARLDSDLWGPTAELPGSAELMGRVVAR